MATAVTPIADILADRFTSRAVNLLRFEEHLRRRALIELRKLERQLVAQLVEGDPTEPVRTAFQQARLEALLRQARQTIATSYRATRDKIDRELYDLAGDEHGHVKKVINGTVGVDIATVGIGETQLRAIVDNTLIEGAPAREWWAGQSKALAKRFLGEMRQGMLRGESNADLVRRVRGTATRPGIMEASRRETAALVRTAVSAVSNGARLQTYQANGDIIRGVQCHATLDGRTSLLCVSRSNSCWSLETGKALPESPRQEPFPGPPPWHFNCLPGDAEVTTSSRIAVKTSRWYEGDLVVIRTASGLELPATPNHPILTDAGWIPAGEVHEVGHVISRCGRNHGLTKPDNEDVPTRIEEIAVPPLSTAGVIPVPVPLAAEDFHGDGGDSEVAVVTADRLLWDAIQTASLEHRLKIALEAGDFAPECLLSRLRGLLKCLIAGGSARSSFLGAPCTPQPFFGAHLGGGYPVGFASRSQPNALVSEAPQDGGVAHAMLLAQLLRRLTGQVLGGDLFGRQWDDATAYRNTASLESTPERIVRDPEAQRSFFERHAAEVGRDRVLEVRRLQFKGHVYNLETASGYYIANGVATHNCRSVLIPVLKPIAEMLRELGVRKVAQLRALPQGTQASMDGQVSSALDYSGWLKTKPKAFQVEVLGAGRWQLWQAGKLSFADLVDQSGRPRRLAELREAA